MRIYTEGYKKVSCKHCIQREEKEKFKKKTEQILVDKQQKQKQQESLTIVSTDESFFFMILFCKKSGWIDKNKRHIVRITGSHKHSYIFGGAISIEGKNNYSQAVRCIQW